jgi:hypothetical protein
MSLLFLPVQAANISEMDVSNQSEHKLPQMLHQKSLTHDKNGAVTVLLPLLPIKVSNMAVMHNNDQVTRQLTYLQDHKSLKLS